MRIGLKTKKQQNILGQGHLSLPAKGLSSSDSPCPDLKLSRKQTKDIYNHNYFKTKKGWSKAKLSFANAPENIPSLPYPANTKPLDTLVGVLGLLCSMFLYPFSVFMSINYMMPFRFGIISLLGI
ncbi:MAG TPA: hypothetical protein DCQ99_03600 [Nitrospinae bacterium]|nr:hypothetical protein [Nitrospinota bacterium]